MLKIEGNGERLPDPATSPDVEIKPEEEEEEEEDLTLVAEAPSKVFKLMLPVFCANDF